MSNKHKRLVAAFKRHDYAPLWLAAQRFARGTIWQLRKAGRLPPRHPLDDEDLISEACIEAGRLIPKWKPDRGSLATYLTPYLRSAVIRLAWQDQKRGIKTDLAVRVDSMSVEDCEYEEFDEEELPADEPAYDSPPRGFASPEVEAERLQFWELVAKKALTNNRIRIALKGL